MSAAATKEPEPDLGEVALALDEEVYRVELMQKILAREFACAIEGREVRRLMAFRRALRVVELVREHEQAIVDLIKSRRARHESR